MKSTRGFTLVEILVALFLGSLLMSGLMTVYLHVKSSYRIQNALVTVQERERFAAYFFRRAIHHAGDAGCEKDNKLVDQEHAILGNDSAMIIGECVHYKNKNQFIQINYFIGDTKRKNSRGHRIFALYRRTLHGVREELIAGIYKMKIQYGLMAKNHRDIVRYVAANAVTHWADVKSVAMTLSFSYLDTIKLMPLYIDMRERG